MPIAPVRRLTLAYLTFAFLAVSASLGAAQAQTYTPAPTPTPDIAVRVAPPNARFYGGVEYLYWSFKDAPLRVPLISTGPVSNKEGFLINSGSTILYGAPFSPATGGKDTQALPSASGSRLTLGAWLDDAQRWAVEASAFKLARQEAGYVAASNGQGSPGIRLPLYDEVPYKPGGTCDNANPSACNIGPTEDGFPVAIPNELYGSAVAHNSIELWGADLSGVMKLYSGPGWELSGLAGLKFLSLEEGFGLTDNLNGTNGSFFQGQSGTENDSFKTRNRFYGAGVGLRGRYSYGPFSAELTGRVAIGDSNEMLSVQGYYVDAGASFPTTSGNYGVFAQPGNEGKTTRNNFAVVPEVQLKLGYALTNSIRLTIGYDFLYDSNVIRPGDQINRNIPKGQTFQQDYTATTSTTSPTRLFRTTDFFAHGLTAGVGFQF